MTKEFAINILEQYREKPTLINDIETVEEAVWLDEALDIAIKALEQDPKTGYWIYKEKGVIECSNCGMKSIFLQIRGNEEGGVIDQIKNYCPSCGAKMEEMKE